MVKDAELHAEEDKNIKEIAKEFNEVDQLTYTIEKSVNSAPKLDAGIKKELEDAVRDARDVMHSNDLQKLKNAKQNLTTVLNKHSQAMQNASQEQAAPQGNEQEPKGGHDKPDEKIVDAEVVEDDK